MKPGISRLQIICFFTLGIIIRNQNWFHLHVCLCLLIFPVFARLRSHRPLFHPQTPFVYFFWKRLYRGSIPPGTVAISSQSAASSNLLSTCYLFFTRHSFTKPSFSVYIPPVFTPPLPQARCCVGRQRCCVKSLRLVDRLVVGNIEHKPFVAADTCKARGRLQNDFITPWPRVRLYPFWGMVTNPLGIKTHRNSY